MGSSNKKPSGVSYAIVVDNRTASTNPHDTMSSHRGTPNLRTGSDSQASSSTFPRVRHEECRSPQAGDYKVDMHHRSDVSIYNHHGSGHEDQAPHPEYRSSSKKEEKKSSTRR
ncbi:uncharacterized protein GGS25DRAFT_525605 [Hypoxylon fragiforme]|uniref:uncharacterized protein n=1 Tax=Hypoxylon fragiforme TaxID=63214 RepID=UPI0020C679FB|nr:uncharacterized protein GGS25DRAFT_525605 [Hypoxylon fragiforme]KAI2604327.1 hypothetical protein GGS25DRAFT_525605 [Hypoxylon fragiforme]